MQSKVDTPKQTSLTTTHWDQTQAVWHLWIESIINIKPSRSVFALNLMPSMQLSLVKYGGSDNAQWISMNKMTTTPGSARAVRHNFREFASFLLLCAPLRGTQLVTEIWRLTSWILLSVSRLKSTSIQFRRQCFPLVLENLQLSGLVGKCFSRSCWRTSKKSRHQIYES